MSSDARPARASSIGGDSIVKSHHNYTKRILITGGAGFIGSHVVIRLVKTYPQYKVVVLDKLDYCGSLKHLETVASYPNYSFVKVSFEAAVGDSSPVVPLRPRSCLTSATTCAPFLPPSLQGSITSSDLVTYILRKEKIDTVMHFAAQTHVDNSFGNSLSFTETNILGTHVLLEASKEAKIKLFIHVSTDEVYGEGSSLAPGMLSTEASALEPTNPYSATKAGAEYLCKAYHRSFNLPIIITRGNNVYGPHQYPEKIVPKFVSQTLRGLPLTLHGDGSNSRNYLFVEDVARAFDVILHKGRVGEVYNMGGKNELTNLQVAKEVLRVLGLVPVSPSSSSSSASPALSTSFDAGQSANATTGSGSILPSPAAATDAAAASSSLLTPSERRFILQVKDRPFNDLRYPLDCSKLEELGWREEVSWEEGLRMTVEWYLTHPATDQWTLKDVEQALVAHPRRGLLPSEAFYGLVAEDNKAGAERAYDEDPIQAFIRERAATAAESAAAFAAAATAASAAAHHHHHHSPAAVAGGSSGSVGNSLDGASRSGGGSGVGGGSSLIEGPYRGLIIDRGALPSPGAGGSGADSAGAGAEGLATSPVTVLVGVTKTSNTSGGAAGSKQ